MQEFYADVTTQFVFKKDEIIKNRLSELGLPTDVESLKKLNLSNVIDERDGFEHLYIDFGLPAQQRIISFEKKTNMDWSNENKFNISQKYY